MSIISTSILGYFKNKLNSIFAKQDGSYANLGAGVADQLSSSVGIEDQTPYNSRTSGGSVDIGDREKLNAVVGVSVPWNQLVPKKTEAETKAGITYIGNNDGTISVSGTSTGTSFYNLNVELGKNKVVPNHVYYIGGLTDKNGEYQNVYITVLKDGSSTIGTNVSTDSIRKYSYTAGTYSYWRLNVANGNAVPDGCVVTPQIFDLTQMLGETIADYIYALEQSNAGAGVAYFRKLFPKPYYAYNSSEMLSARTNLHRMVGFNQWDEEWELGYYNVDTGVSSASNSQIRCKNKIKVVPNTTYYIKTSSTLWILEYDADDIYLNKYTSKTNQVFTTSANTQYIRFYALSSYGTTYNHDICINLHWDGERDGEYEPYEAHEYALSDITLRGMLILDANNNLHADGDRYLPDGTVERRYGIVDLGTLSWTYDSNNAVFYSTSIVNDVKLPVGGESQYRSSKYIAYPATSRSTFAENAPNDSFCITSSGVTKNVVVKDTSYTDAAAFKTAMSGVYLVYELATPTTETADPYQQTQIVDDFGTEEFVDAAVEANERDVAIPVGHETFYQNNLKAKLEMAPNSPDGDGVYVVQQSNGENEYIPLVIPTELPTAPTDDGTYVLKITVSDGTVTKAWVEEV